MKRLLLGIASLAALGGAACGGGGGMTITPPPPAGNFTRSSLSGQYVFVTNGEVFTGNVTTSLARTGVFIADGQGGITGGVEDVNSQGSTILGAQITGGNYNVNADGRGTLTLNVLANGVSSTISFAFVLTSGSNGLSPANDGLIIDETTTNTQISTGSGNFVLQTGGPFTISSAAGTYVFDFSGLDGNLNPDSIVGQFNVNNGVVTTGVEDENDNGLIDNGASPPTPVSFNGSFLIDNSTLSNFGRTEATLNGIGYVFYFVSGQNVSGQKMRFISTTGSTMLSGDATFQPTPAPTSLSTGFAFVMAGVSAQGPVTRIGRFTINGAAASNVLVDTNNAGSFHQSGGTNTGNTITSATVAMDATNLGRGVITIQESSLNFPYTFVFYMSSAGSGVIQDDTVSPSGTSAVADGSILAQSGSPFSSANVTGTYAFNWSGVSQQSGAFDEEDTLAQTTVSNLALSGTADVFQFTNGLVQGAGLNGTITIGGDGAGDDGNRSSLTVNLSGAIKFEIYFVDPQFAFFAINTNQSPTRIVAGTLKAQQ